MLKHARPRRRCQRWKDLSCPLVPDIGRGARLSQVQEITQARLVQTRGQLNDREATVIRQRFGRDDDATPTLGEIGAARNAPRPTQPCAKTE